jgi:hypothetical protein
MKNKALNDIKQYAIRRLNQEYGYAGVAESDNFIMINSGGEGENLIIKITDEADDANG